MKSPARAQYGAWQSTISAADVAKEAGRLAEPRLLGKRIYWTERRPLEGGRTVVVESGPEGNIDLVPAPFNVRSRVHEYGGGAYTVWLEEESLGSVARSILLFSHFADNRLYRLDPGAAPRPITPEAPAAYADLAIDTARRRLLAVRELSQAKGEPKASIVAVPLNGGDLEADSPESDRRDPPREPEILVEGADFYSNPRTSPDGTKILWLSWQHPNMPWDETSLWLADLDSKGRASCARRVAGDVDESIFQPEWSPEGDLFFVSDRSGFWNLYRIAGSELDVGSTAGAEPRAVCVAKQQAEMALPQWLFGMRTYDFAGPNTVVCAFSENGIWRLGRVSLKIPRESSPISHPGRLRDPGEEPGAPAKLELISDRFTLLDGLVADEKRALFLGAAPDLPSALVELDLEGGSTRTVQAVLPDPNSSCLSRARAIEFPGARGETAHAFFYPPKNDQFQGPEGEKPPLLVKSHGGPTAAADTGYNLGIQFWTSRGFAVVDVNYGGSTGFGRAYRRRLEGAWGIVDVDDCIGAAESLASQGLVDRERLAIRGGSAGGYTTLAALAFRDVFRAGASYYGIGDLEALARDTHKFESRYLDRLVGPYPERRDVYRERSPIHAADQLSCPVIFFQGLDDKVVPVNQERAMVAALQAKGVTVEALELEGEGHGFRKAENIARTLEAELAFYGRVFGFRIAGP